MNTVAINVKAQSTHMYCRYVQKFAHILSVITKIFMEAIMRDYLEIHVLDKCTKLYMRTNVKNMSITRGIL